MAHWIRLSLWVALGLFTAACGDGEQKASPGPTTQLATTGDLDVVNQRGTLRILVERESDLYLPRHGAALYGEREIAARFAMRLGLDAQLVFVDRFTDLLPALLEGKGDLVAANLTVTEERMALVAFTAPLGYSADRLAVAANNPSPTSGGTTEQVLTGTIAAREGTTLLQTARRVAANHPGLTVVAIEANLSNEALLDQVARGEIDYAVQDANFLDTALGYRNDVIGGTTVTEPRPLAWAVRPENPLLLTALNEYLAEYRLIGEAERQYVGDLQALKERGRLRMITRNNAATYFLWRGELLGFEYELAKRLADQLGVRLEVVVAGSHQDMIPMLLAGDGDFIAAYQVATDERRAMGVDFTRAYHYASEVIVGRADEPEMTSLADLAGRQLVVRKSSAYWAHVQAMITTGELDLELVAAPDNMETHEIIHSVAKGDFDLTVADSHILAIELTWRDDIKAITNLVDKQSHAWVVRLESSALLAKMNSYLKETYRGLHYNISYAKYFENTRFTPSEATELHSPGKISPYDDLAKKYAAQYDIDWRIAVAQMHRESRFDPKARSWMGAVGLMQVLPRTAKEYGFTDLEDPETNIQAGLRHLAWVRQRFPKRLEPDEKLWFALAGYNAGHGHVGDARRLAQKLGLDPDQWFDNVERAMLKLEQPEYSRQARHGFVRGREPVQYVQEIRDRFQAYARVLSN